MSEVMICKAASMFEMDYELLEYITKRNKVLSGKEIAEKVDYIFMKYKKYFKIYRNCSAANFGELFAILVVLFPNMKLSDNNIVAKNNDLLLNVSFENEIVINIDYYGIKRYIRILNTDDDCFEIMRKDDTCSANTKLRDIYKILGIRLYDLDFKEINQYQDQCLVYFYVFMYETEDGIIVNDYQCEGYHAGTDQLASYYACKFEPTLIEDKKEIARPEYTLVQEVIPDDEAKGITALDYIEISQKEYQNMITFSEVKADSGIHDDNSLVNAVLLERKLPNYSVPPFV